MSAAVQRVEEGQIGPEAVHGDNPVAPKPRPDVAGPVPQAYCTRAISKILGELPGFEGLGTTWFPDKLSARFGALPGVVTTEHNENDSDSLRDARRAIARQLES